MAAGEYVSVSSQRDAEQADIRLEEHNLRHFTAGELRELAVVYEQRGLPPALANEVALTLSRRGALEAHARDELGLDDQRLARPSRRRGRRRCRSLRVPHCRCWPSRPRRQGRGSMPPWS